MREGGLTPEQYEILFGDTPELAEAQYSPTALRHDRENAAVSAMKAHPIITALVLIMGLSLVNLLNVDFSPESATESAARALSASENISRLSRAVISPTPNTEPTSPTTLRPTVANPVPTSTTLTTLPAKTTTDPVATTAASSTPPPAAPIDNVVATPVDEPVPATTATSSTTSTTSTTQSPNPLTSVAGESVVAEPVVPPEPAPLEPASEPEPLPPQGQDAGPASDAPIGCHDGYAPCIPDLGTDVDCRNGNGNGPRFTGPVTVIGPDEYELDRDGDGVACEE